MALVPQFNRMKFSDVWNNKDSFWHDYNESGLNGEIDESHANILYFLLIGKYANNIIANEDINQFKYKVFSIIFSFGGEWQRKLKIQKDLREMSDDDLIHESTTIMNHASNPSTKPSTGDTGELKFVDDQNVSKRKRAKLDAYQFLWSVLRSDITPRFLSKFESLFTLYCAPYIDAVYCSEEEDK